MKRILISFLALLLFSQCSMLKKSEDNDGATALALLGASGGASGGCVIGGQTFILSDGVTCSGGTASGTGTLVAVEGKKDIFMDIEPTIQSGGYVEIFAYAPAANPSTHPTTVIVRINDANKLTNKQNINTVNVTNPVLCLEFRGAPTNELWYKEITCALSVSYKRDFNGSYNSTQRTWGFILNNASLGTVHFYPNGQLQ
jgi:hypothetical protein